MVLGYLIHGKQDCKFLSCTQENCNNWLDPGKEPCQHLLLVLTLLLSSQIAEKIKHLLENVTHKNTRGRGWGWSTSSSVSSNNLHDKEQYKKLATL